MEELRTERLKLTPITMEDAKEVYEHFNQAVIKYLLAQVNRNLQVTKEVIAKMMEYNQLQEEEIYVIRLQESFEFLGLVALHDIRGEKPKLGIWLSTKFHGQKYGKEAIGRLIERARVLGLKSLFYPVDYRNIASVKIAQYYQGIKVKSKEKVITNDDRTLYIDTYEIKL